MAAVSVSTTPVTLDTGTAAELFVVNTGTVSVHVVPPNQRVRPGQSIRVRTAGAAVTAFTQSATGSTVDVTTIGPVFTPTGGAVSTTVKLGLAPSGAPQVVSARGHIPHDQSVTGVVQKTARAFFPLVDATVTAVQPVFALSFQGTVSGAADVEAPNDVQVGCAVEHSDGTIVPVTFGGQHLGTISRDGTPLIADAPVTFGTQTTSTDRAGTPAPLGKNGVVVRTFVKVRADRTDTAGVTSGSNTITDTSITVADTGRLVTGTGIPAAAYVYNVTAGTSFQLASTPTTVNPTLVNATANGTSVVLKDVIPSNLGPYASVDNVTADGGADLTLAGSGVVSGGTFAQGHFGPAVLLGAGTKTRMVVAVTDSIYDGLSDPTTQTYLGPVARACIAADVPLVKLSRGGQSSQRPADASTRRLIARWVPGCTDALIEIGTNDGSLSSATGVIQVQDRLVAIAYWLKSQGVKRVGVATIPPRTTSTDGFATTGNQTVTSGSVAVYLAAVNDWIRTVPAPFDSYVDLADATMSARNSGIWTAGATADGVHPSAALMSGTVTTQLTAWLAALP